MKAATRLKKLSRWWRKWKLDSFVGTGSLWRWHGFVTRVVFAKGISEQPVGQAFSLPDASSFDSICRVQAISNPLSNSCSETPKVNQCRFVGGRPGPTVRGLRTPPSFHRVPADVSQLFREFARDVPVVLTVRLSEPDEARRVGHPRPGRGRQSTSTMKTCHVVRGVGWHGDDFSG
jgi:hypothetical protein